MCRLRAQNTSVTQDTFMLFTGCPVVFIINVIEVCLESHVGRLGDVDVRQDGSVWCGRTGVNKPPSFSSDEGHVISTLHSFS